MARTTRAGHYGNPYAVAEWSRPPPTGTSCEPLVLETADRAVAGGWLYARGGETTAVVLVHPRANFSHHYAVPGLVDAGYAVLCLNTVRKLGRRIAAHVLCAAVERRRVAPEGHRGG
jgi:hypothetical protein